MIDKLEWFISPYELCKVIYKLRDNKILRINPAHGIIKKKDWLYVGYKGGSEPGVLNYTWILKKDNDSPIYTVSCSINNVSNQIDTIQFTSIVSRLVKLIQDGKL